MPRQVTGRKAAYALAIMRRGAVRHKQITGISLLFLRIEREILKVFHHFQRYEFSRKVKGRSLLGEQRKDAGSVLNRRLDYSTARWL